MIGQDGGRTEMRRSGRVVLFLGTAGVLVTPLAQALSTGGPAGAASSNVDPNGVLKYGFDLNNEFEQRLQRSATEENDCSYTVSAEHLPVDDHPGEHGHRGWGGPELDHLQQQQHRSHFTYVPASNLSSGQPVTSSADVAASLNHTKTSPLRSSLFAISSIQTPDPSTVGRQPEQADRG